MERFNKSAKRKNVRLVIPVPVCNLDQEVYKDMKENKVISHGCHILFGPDFVLEANRDFCLAYIFQIIQFLMFMKEGI